MIDAGLTMPVATGARPADITDATTLHELLALALDDFEHMLGDPRYKIDFGFWHEPDEDGGDCSICMAGAVIARRLCLDPTQEKEPDFFGIPVARRLHAIDQLRLGNIKAALGEMRGAAVHLTWRQRRLANRWWLKLRPFRRNEEFLRDDAHALLRSLRYLQSELQECGL
jgi:hypothetical protein